MEENRTFQYEVKCRRCNKITLMYFGAIKDVEIKTFKSWASEHSTFPIQKQCECNNGFMMFHDLVSYGNILDLI